MKIIVEESKFLKERNELRRQLFRDVDHENKKTFNYISRGSSTINLTDLNLFLLNNGFKPSSDDIDAILRRCDHNAASALDY